MKRCRTCLIPDTRPDTYFDETGECSACRSYKGRPEINWNVRKQELINLLDRHNGRCIVPSSGGKDSTYQALTLKALGAEVVCVTAETCQLTEIGRRNLNNLADQAKAIRVVPQRSVRATLNRLGLALVGDISWSEHASIFGVPFRMSILLGIPLIFYGESPQNQYGGPPGTAEAKQMTRRWIAEFGGFLGLRAEDFIGMEGLTERDMVSYQPPSENEIAKASIEAHFLGQYIPWDSDRNAEFSKAHGFECQLPCQANWWPCENLDNAQTGIHDHAMFRKYGYGRAAAQLSVDIRKGKITREAGMEILRERDGVFPEIYGGVHIDEICRHIGISRENLMTTLDKFTNWDLFEKEDNRFIPKDWCLQPA